MGQRLSSYQGGRARPPSLGNTFEDNVSSRTNLHEQARNSFSSSSLELLPDAPPRLHARTLLLPPPSAVVTQSRPSCRVMVPLVPRAFECRARSIDVRRRSAVDVTISAEIDDRLRHIHDESGGVLAVLEKSLAWHDENGRLASTIALRAGGMPAPSGGQSVTGENQAHPPPTIRSFSMATDPDLLPSLLLLLLVLKSVVLITVLVRGLHATVHHPPASGARVDEPEDDGAGVPLRSGRLRIAPTGDSPSAEVRIAREGGVASGEYASRSAPSEMARFVSRSEADHVEM
ncbi:MAG: hypothetical protein M1826_003177 [Phylliscum demangeonii]|nr:MAG: hypothetical protein M1826_003177 [Phylliscum demangeonii]